MMIVDEHEEYQYLKICKNILDIGVVRNNRTNIETKSIFGVQMRYNLRSSFPLLTTKKVFWKGVLLELLWIIKGSTDSELLAKEGVHIWDANGSREFLDNLGFKDREVGDLGPVYGFQWRHFGAKYVDKNTDYSGQGIDQLAEVIRLIKTDPNNRRIVLSAWNPIDINKMALPPCHTMFQFYVANNELSCQMYQRSADFALGVPFNIASYSLLTHMIAHICNLNVGDFIHCIGDTHIYLNHEEAIKQQIQRQPFPFPQLKIKRNVASIDDFKFEDFEILDYCHHSSLSMKMAV